MLLLLLLMKKTKFWHLEKYTAASSGAQGQQMQWGATGTREGDETPCWQLKNRY
jgi:hypothetical protein